MSDEATPPDTPREGLLMAFTAYGLWGVFPIYYKQLGGVPPLEVLAHRVVWSMVFMASILTVRRSWSATLSVLRDASKRRAMFASTALVALNWGLFIWAVSVGRVTDASLGYYINPLLNVLLGRVVLGETLRPWQTIAVATAAAGVAYLTIARGELPWVALVLAVSFALYGLVRKRAPVGALDGLAIETGLAAPAAILYLALLHPPLGHLSSASPKVMLLLLGSGVATAVPLLAFAGAARRLRFTTLGMVQFLAPTLQLGCAVLLYRETFRAEHAIAFGLIWGAVAIYLADGMVQRRLRRQLT